VWQLAEGARRARRHGAARRAEEACRRDACGGRGRARRGLRVDWALTAGGRAVFVLVVVCWARQAGILRVRGLVRPRRAELRHGAGGAEGGNALGERARPGVHGLQVLARRSMQAEEHFFVVLALHEVEFRLLVHRAHAVQNLRRRVRQAAALVQLRVGHVRAQALELVRLVDWHAESLHKVLLLLVTVQPQRVRVAAERALRQPSAVVAKVQHDAP
jgi:hypothetical protein